MHLVDWINHLFPRKKEIVIESRIPSVCLDPMMDDDGREKIWCETYTGKRVYPTYFQACGVDIEDIAHSLAHQCRYNGHTQKFYSVAEHCIHMADYAMDDERLPSEARHALLHDAQEAYIGDIPRPVKCAIPAIKEAEDRIEKVICEVFNLPSTKPAWLDELDARIVVDERDQAMSRSGHAWVHDVLEPLDVTLGFWKPQDAKFLFLRRYSVLTELIENGDCNE